MSYRLKRKRFNCDNCIRQWNQLVGQDIEEVMCKFSSADPVLITRFNRRLVLATGKGYHPGRPYRQQSS